MSKPKLTPWFPGDVKPARVGVYERTHDFCTNPAWAKWTGRQWMCSSWISPKHAAQASMVSGYQESGWRGLASNPKAKS